MARELHNLPEGDKPITGVGIARTRFVPTFEAELPNGQVVRGQFAEVVKRVGLRLELQNTEPYTLVKLSTPVVGEYESGTKFRAGSVSLFTNTSKMPGPSFALPAGPPAFGGTCPAAALGENTAESRRQLETRLHIPLRRQLPVIQGLGDAEGGGALMPGVQKSYNGDAQFVCRGCYALGGNYNYPSKQVNDMIHQAWVDQELRDGGPHRLAQALAYAIQHINMARPQGFQPYFRIHDAGDFFSEDYLEAWVQCAILMPHMRFWAPTRQWVFRKWVPILQSAQDRVRRAGGWLVIRPSVLRTFDPVPMLDGLAAGSGVSAEKREPCVWVCPVYNKLVPRAQPDGSVLMEEAVSCLEAQCTMCWDQPNVPVSYGLH